LWKLEVRIKPAYKARSFSVDMEDKCFPTPRDRELKNLLGTNIDTQGVSLNKSPFKDELSV
jgi:hypothetical protein